MPNESEHDGTRYRSALDRLREAGRRRVTERINEGVSLEEQQRQVQAAYEALMALERGEVHIRPVIEESVDRTVTAEIEISPSPGIFPAWPRYVSNQMQTISNAGLYVGITEDEIRQNLRQALSDRILEKTPRPLPSSIPFRYSSFPEEVIDVDETMRARYHEHWFRTYVSQPPVSPPGVIGYDYVSNEVGGSRVGKTDFINYFRRRRTRNALPCRYISKYKHHDEDPWVFRCGLMLAGRSPNGICPLRCVDEQRKCKYFEPDNMYLRDVKREDNNGNSQV